MVLPVPGLPGAPGPPGQPGPEQAPPEPQVFLDDRIPYYPPAFPDTDIEPKMAKPDADTVLRRIDDIKKHWNLRDERMDEDQNYYRGNVGERTAAGNLLIRNIPAIMVEKAARVLGTQEPRYNVVPPKNIVKSEAQRIEDFIRHSWSQWNKRWYLSGFSTIYHDMAHYLALRGWLAARIQYNPDARTGELPIRLRLVDPRNVYPHFSEGDDGLLYVGHIYQQTVAQVRDLYPDAKGAWQDREETEYVTCKAYYDDWWYGFFIEEDEVIPIQAHEYGFVPWTILIGGGSPVRHTENDTQEWVAEVGPSIFHHIKHAYLAINRLLSQLADEIERASNPPLLFFIDPQNKKQPVEISFDPGATNHLLYDRERVEPLQIGPSTTNPQPLFNMLMEDIEKGGLPSTLWGFGDESSGFQTTINQTAARDALFPIVRAMEYAQEDINRKCLQLIRDWHDEDVGYFVRDEVGELVSGETVNFQLIDMVGTESRVQYRDVSPQDKLARANIAIALVKEKLISMETARSEYLELDNPERENDRVVSDLVYMDEDVVKNVIIGEVLRRSDPWLYQAWEASREQQRTNAQEQQAQQAQQANEAPPAGLEQFSGGGGSPGMEQGVPPDALPPNMQGLEQMLQAAGGAQGGVGQRRPRGIPGAGALPVRMPVS